MPDSESDLVAMPDRFRCPVLVPSHQADHPTTAGNRESQSGIAKSSMPTWFFRIPGALTPETPASQRPDPLLSGNDSHHSLA